MFKKIAYTIIGLGVFLTSAILLHDVSQEEILLSGSAGQVSVEKIVQSLDRSTTTVEYKFISTKKLNRDDYYFSGDSTFSDGKYIKKGDTTVILFDLDKVYLDSTTNEVFEIQTATTSKEEWDRTFKKEKLFSFSFLETVFAQSTTTTYTGNATWTAPAGVTSVAAACWGGGGGGGDGSAYGGGGGGGGGFASSTIAVTPLSGYSVVVGAKGLKASVNPGFGTNGGTSTFNGTSVIARGGTGGGDNETGPGGTGTGDVAFTGGTGAVGHTSDGSGGGGGAAGPNGNGVGGTGGSGTSGSAGGAGNNGLGGTAGAAGGAGNGGDAGAHPLGGGGGGGGGNARYGGYGGAPGGGGGGGENNALNVNAHADGGAGQCTVTYTIPGGTVLPETLILFGE